MSTFSQISSNHFLTINIFNENQSNYEELTGQYPNSSMKLTINIQLVKLQFS